MTEEVKEGEIVVVNPPSASVPKAELIMGANSVEQATRVANQLQKVVEQQKLYVLIQDKKYVMVEGWNTLGALMGIFPEVVEVEKLPTKIVKMILVKQTMWNSQKRQEYLITKLIKPEFFDPTDVKMQKIEEKDFEEISYRAVVRLRTYDGKEMSRAESFCSNLEDKKQKNEEYAISSMAQTRAAGKVFRLAFSWIMKMAGYEATPAEEMPAEGFVEATVPPPVAHSPAPTPAPYRPNIGSPTSNGTAAQAMRQGMSSGTTSTILECKKCAALINHDENNYSIKFYGLALCRSCQKTTPKK